MTPMKASLTALAFALASVLPAQAADLLGVYRDARLADPVYQAARAQFQATTERLPQARAGYLPTIAGTGSIFRNHSERGGVGEFDYTTKTIAVTLGQPVFRMQNLIAITQAQKVVLQAEATL